MSVVRLAVAAGLLAAGCHHGAPAAPALTAGLRLPAPVRAIGDRWTKTDDSTTSLVAGEGADAQHLDSRRHQRAEHQILALGADGAITKVDVTYRELSEVDTGPRLGHDSPLRGHRYLVWAEGGAIHASTADGAAVSDAELAALASDQAELGRPPPMEQVLAGRVWKVGERYQLTAAELDRLIASRPADGPRVTSFTLTLDEVEGGRATFALTTTLASEAPVEFTIDMTGKVEVDVATGTPRRVELQGPVAGTAAGMPVSGTMTSLVVYER